MNHNTTILSTDIIIIGAGPTGLFTIFEAGMLKMHCHVIDTLEMIGGQCSALYPEKPIYDIPAHPKILAQDLIENLSKQAEPFHPVYHLGQKVIKLETDKTEHLVTTDKGTKIKAKIIIIAAGCGAFGPNKPPINNIEDYEGKSLFYLVQKREDFRNKNIVIAGGGDSAIDWAISLSEVANSITLVHRRPKFRCAPESYDQVLKLVAAKKIELAIPYQLDSLEGNNGQISAVILSDLEGNKKTVQADRLLAFFGLAMELGPIAEFGLNLDKKHILVEPSTMQSSSPGIYAIGDIAHYPNKLKLILSGFAESAMACYSARKVVFPNSENHFEYSTTSGVHDF